MLLRFDNNYYLHIEVAMKPTNLALAFLLAACFPWEGIANEGSDQLFIYTSRHNPIDETLIHKFED